MMAKLLRNALLSAICFCILLTAQASLHGDESRSDSNSKDDAKTQKSAQQAKSRTLNFENENLAQELAREHLPQLTSVLKQLKTDQPRQYERAVWDLARSAKKLHFAQKRDEQLFKVELELLKAETAANLLAARLTVRDNPNDRSTLREAVARLRTAKQTKMRYEIDMYQKRLERDQALLAAAEQSLSDFEENTKNTVIDSYQAMLRKAGRKPETSTPKKKRQKTVTTSSER
jgi:hypothetical protein